MEDDTVQFCLKIDLKGLCIFSNALYADVNFTNEFGFFFGKVEGDNIRVIVVIKKLKIDFVECGIRAKNVLEADAFQIGFSKCDQFLQILAQRTFGAEARLYILFKKACRQG